MEINLNELKNDWRIEDSRLKLTVKLPDFMACVEKVNEIARIAQEQDHHPNLCITDYKNLEVELFTHSESTLTEKDLNLAKAIDKIL